MEEIAQDGTADFSLLRVSVGRAKRSTKLLKSADGKKYAVCMRALDERAAHEYEGTG